MLPPPPHVNIFLTSYISECYKKTTRLCAISAGEIIYLFIVYLLLLSIAYILIALHGFSLSYSKIWPSPLCLKRIAFLFPLMMSGHFLFRRSQWYTMALLGLHFIVLFALLAVYVTTGTFFCESILYLIYDTSIAEIKDFLAAYLSLKSVSILAVTIGFFGTLLWGMHKLYIPSRKFCRGDIVCYGICVLLSFPLLFRPGIQMVKIIISHHPFTQIRNQIALFNHHAGEFTYEMRRRKSPDNISLDLGIRKAALTGVLVIGESAIRSHHSIYGYGRLTTPNLLRHSKQITAFDDVITVLPMTIKALMYWLTNMTLDNRHVGWTIFDVLKKAGYSIDVFTNQNKSGWADSPLQMIFSSADSITYMHEENFSNLPEDNHSTIYDENLLPHFRRWLKEHKGAKQPALAVIHLFGSHDPFRSRYPKDIERHLLDDKSFSILTNEYDTSIFYSDKILGEILDSLAEIDNPGFMIYFSDHGTVCDGDRLRTPNSPDNSAYEIPLLVWTNRWYDMNFKNTERRIKAAKSVPLQCDRAHYGLLEIMRVNFVPECSTMNFLSPDFQRVDRTKDEGKRPYVRESSKR